MLADVAHRVSSPVVVSGSGQLSALVAAGQRSAIMVGGEAGVGKSRLVSEFAGRSPGRRTARAAGCREFGADGLPFAPFTSVLRGVGAAGVAEMLPGGTGALARLLAELGDRRSAGRGGSAGTAGRADADGVRAPAILIAVRIKERDA